MTLINTKGPRLFVMDMNALRGDDDNAVGQAHCDCPAGTCANDNDERDLSVPSDTDPEFDIAMAAFMSAMMGGHPMDLAQDLEGDEYEGEEIPAMSAHDKAAAVAQLGRTIESLTKILEAHTALVVQLVAED